MWKHFNILWKKMKRGSEINGGIFFPCYLFFICFFILFSLDSGEFYAANKSVPVEMVVHSDNKFYTKDYHVKLEILFGDMNYYNEDLFASYHLIDSKTRKNIQFENQRIRIPNPLGDNSVEVDVDLNLENMERYKELTVQFDIVDEKNVFWFSEQIVGFQMPEIRFIDDVWLGIVSEVKNEIVNSPIIFGINILITCIFIIICLHLNYGKNLKFWKGTKIHES